MQSADKPGTLPEWFERGRLRWAWGGWEPPSFYLRAGSNSGGVDARAQWGSDWWERLHSEEHVAAMADFGINLVTIAYYKGFGLGFEGKEQERARELVDLYHQYDIHVLGYCQYTTVYPETMLDDIPDLEDHVQYGPDGARRLYGSGAYYRWQGDLTSRTFIEYLKGVVTHGLGEIGLDGVEWDGTVFSCYCERCVGAFRDFLRVNYAGREYELFGLPHFNHALPPPSIMSADPMYHAWLAFRTGTMHDTLTEIYAHAKSVKDDAIFATYPPAPNLTRSTRDRIMFWSGDYLDLATAECHEMPQVAPDGRLICAMRHIKQSTALDVPCFVTAWIRPEAGGIRAPETASEVKLSIAESAVYGGHPFPATWANRPLGRDGRCLYQDPERGGALKIYMNFMRENEALYAGSGPLANVSVYYSQASLDLHRDSAQASLQGIEQVMLQHQIPFRVILGLSQGAEFDCELLCVPDQRLLSNEETHALRNHVAAGGALLVTGETGRYDEHRRERYEDPLADIYDHESVTYLPGLPEAAPSGPDGRVSTVYPYLPVEHEAVAGAIRRGAPRGLVVNVRADSEYVGVDVWRTADGRVAVHLINYNNAAGPTRVGLTLAPWLEVDTGKAALLSPDMQTSLNVAEDGSVTVQGLATYAAVVVG